MNKTAAIILSCLLAVTVSGCGKDKNAPAASSAEPVVATNVTAYTVQPRDVEEAITYTGELKAANTASVSCLASAKVTNVNVDVGSYVEAGRTLIALDTSALRLQYEQAQAAYNSAVAAYNSATGGASQQTVVALEQAVTAAQTAYNTALDNYNREKALFDIGATSQISLNNMKTALDNAELNLNTAKRKYELTVNVVNPESKASSQASVDAAQAALNIARNNLNNASVTAPISGYIATKNVNKGQTVSPGMELFTIKNSGTLDAEISVTESVIQSVHVGTPAIVSVKSAGIENIEGKVSLVNPTKNDQTGLYTVRVSVSNGGDRFKVGMFADISLKTAVARSAVAVPSEAIIQGTDELYIYVVNGENAEKRIVTTGLTDNAFTQLLSGAAEGEVVVVSGKEYISENNNLVKVTGEY